MSHEPTTIRLYTDGSGIDGHIGAAAYCPQISETKQQYLGFIRLGTDSTQNVYVAELFAIKLAVDMAPTSAPQYRKCVIYADSQPAIKASTSPSHQSGQSVICTVLDSIDSLKAQRPDTEISIVWIPGHMDILGNEKADEMAKETAKSKGTTGDPFPLNTLKSMRNNLIKQASKNEWDSTLKHELKSSHLNRIINKVQSYPSSAIYNNINSRRQRVQLARRRTGHCSLNQYLHRFGIEESPLCPCAGNGAEETVEHYLLHCILYYKERAKLMKEVEECGLRNY
jgi:ribonuclease HI